MSVVTCVDGVVTVAIVDGREVAGTAEFSASLAGWRAPVTCFSATVGPAHPQKTMSNDDVTPADVATACTAVRANVPDGKTLIAVSKIKQATQRIAEASAQNQRIEN